MIIEPEIVKENYRQPPDNARRQKKIRCVVVSGSDREETGYYMPTVVAKPQTKKYGEKWFVVNNMRYWIIYSLLKDMGKYYLYITDVNNAVGGIKWYEHGEYADPSQVELMVNQHAIEVHKKNKGIPMKLLLIVGVACAIAVITTLILINIVVGQNNAIGRLNTQITGLNGQIAEKNAKITELENQLATLPPALPPSEGRR